MLVLADDCLVTVPLLHQGRRCGTMYQRTPLSLKGRPACVLVLDPQVQPCPPPFDSEKQKQYCHRKQILAPLPLSHSKGEGWSFLCLVLISISCLNPEVVQLKCVKLVDIEAQ